MQLNRQPLYCQVANELIGLIAKGAWKPGQVIPNEIELARKLGVSTGTMRKALDKLEASHLIVRRQGRGTFILDQTGIANRQRFDLLRLDDGSSIQAISETLEEGIANASKDECRELALEQSDKVLRATRVKSHNGNPYVYEDISIAAKRFPGIDLDLGLVDYTLAELAQRYRVILGQAVEQLTLCEVTDKVANALYVKARSVVLKLHLVAYSFSGEPLMRRIGFSHLPDAKYVVKID
ncbi:GntR family transcriptional regulator [Hyphomicrobium sp. NDB2Meth4]|uniref:GntR family transcriptional regulator n=1 Tax=Hyphomicrobium sp. NDB2Meth4 TaxID=1892846 RepID=UPI0009300A76|nr:GntR family transcriptional regulator [Hyphomicrobium sp. NDB2Meth4]